MTTFRDSPEKEASYSSFLYRQLFVHPSAVAHKDVSLHGKIAIITGSNGGLGFECARQLLDLGLSKLIIAVRNEAKGKKASAELSAGRALKTGAIEVWKLDLSSCDSVLAFAERARTLERLDVVVLNAGLNKLTFSLNPSTGHEESIQVHYLSNTLLLMLLLPIIKAKRQQGKPGRKVLISSDRAAWAPFKEKYTAERLLTAMDQPESFDLWDRYSTSKLLGLLFLVKLAKRVPPSVVVVNAPNPGYCYGSRLGRETAGVVKLVGDAMARIFGRSTPIGARVIAHAVVRAGEDSHGQYIGDCELKAMAPMIYTTEGQKLAQQLWRETMDELSFAGVEEIVREVSGLK
ncbi:Uu.00g009600.m01.CDS01 [Anthostomella pinea]|uniref:Uu.00g009600.m01.CDS01 n=1 Tax=Anthostomella pinea TaxID=933095 RepID=A0AAI8VXF1_9PEZI|nr:Uu.00g009600.m01.CDS01 [Anthostomella pinea]